MKDVKSSNVKNHLARLAIQIKVSGTGDKGLNYHAVFKSSISHHQVLVEFSK